MNDWGKGSGEDETDHMVYGCLIQTEDSWVVSAFIFTLVWHLWSVCAYRSLFIDWCTKNIRCAKYDYVYNHLDEQKVKCICCSSNCKIS